MPRRHVLARKKIIIKSTKHSRVKGPSDQRRMQRRRKQFTDACGCVHAKHALIPCKEHEPPPSGEAEKFIQPVDATRIVAHAAGEQVLVIDAEAALDDL